jgi:Fibronectin type III domain
MRISIWPFLKYEFKLFIILVFFMSSCSKEKNEDASVIKAPTLLTAQNRSPNEISLTWTDNSNNEDGFKIERKTTLGSFTIVESVGKDQTSYNDIGLMPGNVYTYRIFSFNSSGRSVSYSNEANANTYFGSKPYAETVFANQIEGKKAKLNAIVNPNNANTVVIFEYGLTQSYGNFAFSSSNYLEGILNVEATALISDLKGNTTYHYRISAENSFGMSYGLDKSFKTLGDVPIAYTNDASSITDSSVIIKARVFPNYLDTKVSFEFGTSIAYDKIAIAIPSPVLANSDTTLVFSEIISLKPNTKYHYRVRAENELGVKYGEDNIFTTKN